MNDVLSVKQSLCLLFVSPGLSLSLKKSIRRSLRRFQEVGISLGGAQLSPWCNFLPCCQWPKGFPGRIFQGSFSLRESADELSLFSWPVIGFSQVFQTYWVAPPSQSSNLGRETSCFQGHRSQLSKWGYCKGITGRCQTCCSGAYKFFIFFFLLVALLLNGWARGQCGVACNLAFPNSNIYEHDALMLLFSVALEWISFGLTIFRLGFG